jgi:hypothetical protein
MKKKLLIIVLRRYCVVLQKNKNMKLPFLLIIATVKPLTKADSVSKAIESHGGDLYKTADYTFEFRGKNIVFTIKERTILIQLRFKRRFTNTRRHDF